MLKNKFRFFISGFFFLGLLSPIKPSLAMEEEEKARSGNYSSLFMSKVDLSSESLENLEDRLKKSKEPRLYFPLTYLITKKIILAENIDKFEQADRYISVLLCELTKSPLAREGWPWEICPHILSSVEIQRLESETTFSRLRNSPFDHLSETLKIMTIDLKVKLLDKKIELKNKEISEIDNKKRDGS